MEKKKKKMLERPRVLILTHAIEQSHPRLPSYVKYEKNLSDSRRQKVRRDITKYELLNIVEYLSGYLCKRSSV